MGERIRESEQVRSDEGYINRARLTTSQNPSLPSTKRQCTLGGTVYALTSGVATQERGP